MSETSKTLMNLTAGLGLGASFGIVAGVNSAISGWLTLTCGLLMFGSLLHDLWKLRGQIR